MRATCHMDWRWYSVVLKEACAPLCSWRDAGGSISWTACSPNTSQSSGQWTTTTQSWSESMERIFRSSCRETNFLDLGQRLMDVCNWKWKDYFYFCFSTNIRAWLWWAGSSGSARAGILQRVNLLTWILSGGLEFLILDCHWIVQCRNDMLREFFCSNWLLGVIFYPWDVWCLHTLSFNIEHNMWTCPGFPDVHLGCTTSISR